VTTGAPLRDEDQLRFCTRSQTRAGPRNRISRFGIDTTAGQLPDVLREGRHRNEFVAVRGVFTHAWRRWGDDGAIACCVSPIALSKQMQFFGATSNVAKVHPLRH